MSQAKPAKPPIPAAKQALKVVPKPTARRKPSGALTYAISKGADVFPGRG